ncbi:protein lethal(2)essential for life-like [Galleria mellonella]|uniref:Protein lethal(2)essential for life-like n=1 Tax=Galleria mellonella TaxID=7137 RepID=A0A6J1WHG8_GALME|nr:protein lethal(2)essential for life-like [Galleria mellonella]
MSILPYLYEMERPLRLMEREMFIPDDFFGFPPFQLAHKNFFGPPHLRHWENVFQPLENLIRPMEQLSAAINRLALNEVGTKITADNEKFQVNIDVQHFSPDEVSVKIVDNQVIVEGKHEEKRDEHGYISRQFVRRYTLPKECLPDTVESKLSSDGVLTITAPKVLALPSIGERIVPITHTGPVQKNIGSQDQDQDLSIVQETAKEAK